MIDVYYWTTPNGHKVTIFLEETGLPYSIKPINIGKGEQFKPEFLAISPNNRIPAIVDNEPAGGGKPISIFESGAILQYLAEKTGKFLPADLRGRTEERQGQKLDDFANLKRWFETIQRREAVQRAYALAKTINPAPPGMTEEAKKILFGQGRRTKS